VTADCVTLWIGDSLGPVERACFKSVLRQGHSLALYCYGKVAGVPSGIEVRDASEVLPESAVFLHERGSVALFADWFRYELQRRALGTWVDADNYFIAPIDMKRPYLFGEQVVTRPRLWRRQRKSIAIGVLRIPADSPMLPPLLGLFGGRENPERASRRPMAHLSQLPWGTTGPFAITAVAERFGLTDQASPCDVFNPVPWYEARWLMDPAIGLEQVISPRTVGVHLWNECIKGFKNKPAPPGSFLDRLHREGGE